MERLVQPSPSSMEVTQGELISLREVIQGMNPKQLRDHKDKMLSEISDRETIVNLINQVLEANGAI